MPVMAPLHRVRPPASRFTDVRAKDPPTGKAPERPAARLATPWLTSSRLASQRSRSVAANVRLIAAGSANPTSATTKAGTRRARVSPHGRSIEKGGSPVGTVSRTSPGYQPTAPTTTPPRRATSTPGKRAWRRRPPITTTTVTAETTSASVDHESGRDRAVHALPRIPPSEPGTPSAVGSWLDRMRMAAADVNPVMTGWESR